jgi:hypothetical protein
LFFSKDNDDCTVGEIPSFGREKSLEMGSVLSTNSATFFGFSLVSVAFLETEDFRSISRPGIFGADISSSLKNA